MNVLVTGGCGYIGSHTCLALQAAGMNPVVVDNLGRPESPPSAASNPSSIKGIFAMPPCWSGSSPSNRSMQ